MNFVEALKITEDVIRTYQQEQPNWFKRLEGTPIVNELAVRFAEALVKSHSSKKYKVEERTIISEGSGYQNITNVSIDIRWTECGEDEQKNLVGTAIVANGSCYPCKICKHEFMKDTKENEDL